MTSEPAAALPDTARGLPCGTRILVGDARQRLKDLPDDSVHCVMTSPPYWGLRAYTGAQGMIGLEATFGEHLASLIEVFAEVRRVLRPDGTLWLNYGDGYASHDPGGPRVGEFLNPGGRPPVKRQARNRAGTYRSTGLSPKNLMMMPARVAMALQDDGWILRSEIVWAKTNPMPESVVDRPTGAHEKVFLFAQRPRYFYDAAAVRTPGSPNTHARRKDGQIKPRKGIDPNDNRAGSWVHTRSVEEQSEIGSNLRNVWRFGVHPFAGAHFATFPPALCEPPIMAGTPERRVCAECGAPRQRSHQKVPHSHARKLAHAPLHAPTKVSSTGWSPASRPTDEWTPGCSCDADAVAATVLDPFGGSGTVGLVANRLHRNAILIEVDAGYAQMAADRIIDEMGMFADVQVA